MKKDCKNCGNGFYRDANTVICKLEEKAQECFNLACNEYQFWINKDNVKGFIDAEIIAESVGQTIYDQGKAQIFNVLEAVMPHDERLKATKRVIQNILASITKDVADELRDVLDDWQIEVTAGGICSADEEEQARKKYEEIKNIIR